MQKVLIVNDSRFEAIILRDILSSMGYTVMVTDEFQVFKHVAEFIPDGIIVNHIMRGTRGDALISRLKIQNPLLKCFLSSSSLLETEKMATGDIDGFIKTPVDRERIKKIFECTA